MYQLQYGGKWRETSHLRPEAFTKLAPDSLQEHCCWNPLWPFKEWETALYGYPRFRLALVSSRYTLSGGHKITRKDSNGNIVSTGEAEVLYPLYHVPKSYHGLYVLEMWRPAAWWYSQGFDGRRAIEYDGAGNGVRSQEPVWPEGNWLAIMNGAVPLCFTRNVSTDLIRWSIYAVHLMFEASTEQLCEAKKQEQDSADEAEEYAKLEHLGQFRPAFPGAAITVPETIQ